MHLGFYHLLINVVAIIPLLDKFEREYGTLTTLALFFGRKTILVEDLVEISLQSPRALVETRLTHLSIHDLPWHYLQLNMPCFGSIVPGWRRKVLYFQLCEPRLTAVAFGRFFSFRRQFSKRRVQPLIYQYRLRPTGYLLLRYP
jgi:hypothetical protein